MDAFLDRAWEHIAAGLSFLGESFYALLQNFHFLGPALLITLLALGTVAVTKVLSKLIITRRYLELEKEYQHWFQLRQEAMTCEDREKGRRMARNIDQAQLNRAYYDYFFEGFLLNIVRRIIPIFFMFGFINEFYKAENMVAVFGREYVMQLPTTSGEPLLAGAVFWYILSLLGCYLGWAIVGRALRKGTGLNSPTMTRIEKQPQN
ncbi:hypothetical protein [Desulfopila sp. IMCC35008]|uniref:hypothetical protein n=1 Tax=Desulfopila sp. IMCC35008 TaxID=2653858 RepID=UPI0013D771A4|nr:hypothetical protein [Desulfopila sp. IMCC35008]